MLAQMQKLSLMSPDKQLSPDIPVQSSQLLKSQYLDEENSESQMASKFFKEQKGSGVTLRQSDKDQNITSQNDLGMSDISSHITVKSQLDESVLRTPVIQGKDLEMSPNGSS